VNLGDAVVALGESALAGMFLDLPVEEKVQALQAVYGDDDGEQDARRLPVADLDGYNGYGSYQVALPCCDRGPVKWSLAQVIRDEGCPSCGEPWSLELVHGEEP